MNRILLIFVGLVFTQLSLAQFIDARSGIKIYFKSDETTFPESWTTAEVNGEGIDLDSSEYARSLRIVKRALKKYPVSILKENLSAVYVLKQIKFYGLVYGGTNSLKKVYMGNSGYWEGYTEHYLNNAFHHEFSSILLRNYPHFIDERKWKSISDAYGDGGVEALKSGGSEQEIDSVWNKMGFVHEYGSSDFENDFNSYAENIFSPSVHFYEAAFKYPKMTRKLEMIFFFYNQLDPSFDKEFFANIALEYNSNGE